MLPVPREAFVRHFSLRHGDPNRVLRTLVTFACIFVASAPAWANNGGPTAAPLADLADFVLNIAHYASWPQAASRKALTICYAHGGALAPGTIPPDQVTTVKGLPVTWQMISSPQQLPGCNVVWLNSDVRPAPRDWIASIREQPILTLSNYADFTADGGIIGAYRIGTDWRFEVNLEALQLSRINIAAVALRLSQRPRAVNGSGDTR